MSKIVQERLKRRNSETENEKIISQYLLERFFRLSHNPEIPNNVDMWNSDQENDNASFLIDSETNTPSSQENRRNSTTEEILNLNNDEGWGRINPLDDSEQEQEVIDKPKYIQKFNSFRPKTFNFPNKKSPTPSLPSSSSDESNLPEISIHSNRPNNANQINETLLRKKSELWEKFTSNLQDQNEEINEFRFKDSKNSTNLLNGLNELRLTKSMCDVILQVEDEELFCHKCVLASLSTYFRAMFNSELAESKQTKIMLNELDSNTVKSIVEYAYTSCLNINESNVQALLSAANLFDIKPVRDACCHYMQWQMDEQNCIGVYCFADAHDCAQLKLVSFKFILDNFKNVVKNDEFLSLSESKLIEIVKDDNIAVSDEKIVFEGCLKWLKYSPEQRLETFYKVLEHVRLPLLSSYFLNDKVQNEPLLNKCEKCKDLVKEAINYNFLKDRRNQIQNERTRSRKYYKHLEALVAICGENDEFVLRTVDAYVPLAERWLGLQNSPFSLSKNGVVASDDSFLYIAGGERSNANSIDSFWQYNSILDEWKELQPMKSHRSELGLAIVDGYVYALGGKNQYGALLSSMERYDPSLNVWENKASLNVELCNPAICSLNGLLYILSDKVNQVYNPGLNSWEEFKKPQHERQGARACALNGRIFLLGGKFSDEITNKVEFYDPVEEKWEFCSPMLESRQNMGVAVLNNLIYVCGGQNSSGEISNTIEAYDITKNEWNFVSVMKKERYWLTCACLRLENPLKFEKKFDNLQL